MINKTQEIFVFIRDGKMIFQNEKSNGLSILTNTHTQVIRELSQSTTKGYYFMKFLSLKGVFFLCKTNL